MKCKMDQKIIVKKMLPPAHKLFHFAFNKLLLASQGKTFPAHECKGVAVSMISISALVLYS